MPNPKQSPTAIPNSRAFEVEDCYAAATYWHLRLRVPGTRVEFGDCANLNPDELRDWRAVEVAALWQAESDASSRLSREVVKDLAAILYTPGNGPVVGGKPQVSAIDGFASEAWQALWWATFPIGSPAVRRAEGQPVADWAKAAWLRQSPETQDANWSRLLDRIREIATPAVRVTLEQERRHLRARLAKVAKPAEVKDDPDYQPAGVLPKEIRGRIRQAARRGSVRFVKRGKLNHYSRTDAKSLWPDQFPPA